MIRSVSEIRAKRNKIIESRKHKYVRRTYTREEYEADHRRLR